MTTYNSPYVDRFGLCMSGNTTQRPSNPSVGTTFFDLDLSLVVTWNGSAWIPMTGSDAGGFQTALHLLDARNSDGSAIVHTSPSSGNFLIAPTLGTSLYLQGESAENDTKTDSAIWEITLPQTYIAGSNIAVTVNGKYVNSAGTSLTTTVAAAAYLLTDAGAMGSTLIATSAQNLTTSAAGYAFTITGTTLAPGARVLLKVTTAITEGGNTGTVYSEVNSVRLTT